MAAQGLPNAEAHATAGGSLWPLGLAIERNVALLEMPFLEAAEVKSQSA
jgi:hypothetical protein